MSESQFNQVLNIELNQIIEVSASSALQYIGCKVLLFSCVNTTRLYSTFCRPANSSMRTGIRSL